MTTVTMSRANQEPPFDPETLVAHAEIDHASALHLAALDAHMVVFEDAEDAE